MTRLEQQSRTREQNAAYLTAQLDEIPGITPARQYEGTTRNAYHLYMFRYNPEAFGGLSRDRFLKALDAEGIPCSGGYSPLNKDDFLTQALDSKGFKRIYSRPTPRRLQGPQPLPSQRRASASKPSGSPSPCCWAPAKTWTRSPRPSAKSRTTQRLARA